MSKLNQVTSTTNNQSNQALSSKAPFLLTAHDNLQVKRGKYLKKAQMIVCYGAGIKHTARTTKLGLRRTRVLFKTLGILRAKMESNLVLI